MITFHLHSKYNPHKEAEQFISSIEGNPAIIVITEPGESYLASVIHEKFPHTKRIAVRYTTDLFSDSDSLWDAVWRPESGSLPFFLLSHIPDEKLAGTRFLSWKPADKAFPNAADIIWKDIRYAITILTSVMHTRSFFGNKWLKNTLDNFIRFEHPASLHFGTRDFILAGAGPSLEQLTAVYTAPYSILAVSSACAALSARHIPIDLCIATDAGYWALQHFNHLPTSIPVAFPLEAAVPAEILERRSCVPLSYSSPLETVLFKTAGIAPLAARENGTVTGTACSLLLQHTNRHIVLAGIDLKATKGFTHARPHISIAQRAYTATRITPLALSLAVQHFSSQALETYRRWFLQLPPQSAQRLYRTGKDGAPLPNITTYTDISAVPHTDVTNCKSGTSSRLSVMPYPAISRNSRKQIVFSLLNAMLIDIPALIEGEPVRLSDDTVSLEKQICALSSYTAYCTALKNPHDKTAQQNLLVHVKSILSALIKRIE